MLAACDLLELASVLFEANQITVLIRPHHVDYFERSMRHLNNHEPSTYRYQPPSWGSSTQGELKIRSSVTT